MSEFVYPPVILALRGMFRALDLRFHMEGTDNVPRSGGAVLVSNHVSYLDFIFSGLGAQPAKRLVRFMAKKEVFDNKVAGPLMRGMHHVPVDRNAGASSYRAALQALKDGEIIGVFAEATISRSFTIKDIKSGAVRMAAAAEVPMIPMAVWGGQRLWTKGRPRRLLQRHVPVSIIIGEPMYPKRGDDFEAATTELRARMSELLDRAQRGYPDKPAGADDGWWQPVHLGGTAPTPEEAAEMDRKDLEARRRRRSPDESGTSDPSTAPGPSET